MKKSKIDNIKNFFIEITQYSNLYKISIYTIAMITALTMIDATNAPSKIIIKYGLSFVLIFIVGVLAIACVWLIHIDVIKIIKSKSINDVDSILIGVFSSSIIYLIITLIPEFTAIYKIVTLCILLIISIVLFINRISVTNLIYKSEYENKCIYDLKDFLENKSITKVNNMPILLSEKDVDYDLLERGFVIKQLCNSIKSCIDSDTTFVIGLDGCWGSGKTTIINNSKKTLVDDKRITIIDDFDPWHYNSAETLLVAMFDSVLKATGFNYSNYSIRHLIKALVSSVLEFNTTGKITNKFLFELDDDNSMQKLKKQFNYYLEKENKTIVWFIDNIDRASEENIVFLLKVISIIFDLKRTVYVLSYDKQRVDKILDGDTEIDRHFLEKIIQLEIKVPLISENSKLSIVHDTFDKMLVLYNEDKNDLPNYEYIYNYLTNKIDSFRELKRLVNSVLPTIGNNKMLYKPDLLALEVVKFYNYELYLIIKNSYHYFVSVDTDKDLELFSISLNRKDFNENGKSFFDNIQEKYGKEELKLLSHVFNSVEHYLKGYDLKPEHGQIDDFYADVNLKCRAASTKYFDLYFSLTENDYIVVTKLYNLLFDKLKNTNEISKADIIVEFFKECKTYMHQEIIEKMWYERDSFEKNMNYPILLGLIKSSQIINNEIGFLVLSAYQRACDIMATLFSKLNKEEKDLIINYFKEHCKYIGVLDQILYWLNGYRINYDEKSKDVNNIENTLNDIYSKIISKPINILDEDNYSRYITWALIKTKRRINSVNDKILVDIQDYIKNIFEEKYIYKILAEMVSESSSGEGYIYCIQQKSFDAYFSDAEVVNNAIKEYPPTTDEESFLFNIYKNYRIENNNPFSENRYISPYKINY